MSKAPTVERVKASMFVSLDGIRGVKIKAYLAYHTEWRGQPAAVDMTGDRYTVADGRLTDWRVHASRAVAGRFRCAATPDGETGAHLTDTARARLSDACKPDALAWLASDEARDELSNAYYRAAVRHLTGTGDVSRDDGARLLEQYGAQMGDNVHRFRALVDAWDAWCDAAQDALA